MLAGENDRLQKERTLRKLEVEQKQLVFLMNRLDAYSTQATLVTGFAFTAFSADALATLPYVSSPIRSYCFGIFSAISMTAAIFTVSVAGHLVNRAERLSLEASVFTATAAVRRRLPFLVVVYVISLLCLFASAAFMMFAVCHELDVEDGSDEDGIGACEGIATVVVGIFGVGILGFVVIFARINKEFDAHHRRVERQQSEGTGIQLRANDSAAKSDDNHAAGGAGHL